MIIWSVFEHKPTVEIVIIAIATFAAILWLSQGLMRLRKRGGGRVLRRLSNNIRNRDAQDVLQHIVFEPRSYVELSIYNGRPGSPVIYPVRILNTRPVSVDIFSYDITIFWDGRPVQKVIWQAPSRDASNGITICPPFDSQEPLPAITIQPDHDLWLDVPVNVGQIANRPAESPLWTAKGNIIFHCANETKTKAFDFSTDNYKLSHEHWVELGQKIRGSFLG